MSAEVVDENVTLKSLLWQSLHKLRVLHPGDPLIQEIETALGYRMTRCRHCGATGWWSYGERRDHQDKHNAQEGNPCSPIA